MNFFQSIYDAVKRKSAELKDRKEFLDLVERKAKPIRRVAYMNQMLKEVINEGKDKAKADSAAKNNSQQKTEEDFGMVKGIEDPYKFLEPSRPKLKKIKGGKTK